MQVFSLMQHLWQRWPLCTLLPLQSTKGENNHAWSTHMTVPLAPDRTYQLSIIIYHLSFIIVIKYKVNTNVL